MSWQLLQPNEHGDWLAQRSGVFSSFIAIGDKDNKNNKQTFFAPIYSNGLKTQRDAWCYNFSSSKLKGNILKTINFYTKQLEKNKNVSKDKIASSIDYDSRNIVWTHSLINRLSNHRQLLFSDDCIHKAMYRPYCKSNIYFDTSLNERVYRIPKLFPNNKCKNITICISGAGAQRDFSALLTDLIPDLHTLQTGQCFPLYYYDEKSIQHPTLFDFNNEQYTRRDGVTDFILEQCRSLYGPKVTKEDIFYYVYGLLYSPDYREQFGTDLKKMLPRLPLVEKPADFWAFSKAGRALAELHLKYEEQPPYSDAVVTGMEHGNFRVEKMRFTAKGDKSVIEYNPWIKISNIPLAAYDYVINGRSAIEWIMDRYQVKVDKASGIKNDPNDWADEHDKPRYILDLLLSIITVSLETMKIVQALPALSFVEQPAAATPEAKMVATPKPHPQVFPHPGREAAIRRILPYILQARPGMSQDKAFQRALTATYPDACATLLADKAQAFNAAYSQSALGQWPIAQDDPVREKELWKSWKNNMMISVNAYGECSVTDEIKYPIQGIEAVLPFILEAGDNYDLGVEQLMTQERFQDSISGLQACFTQLTEARKAIEQEVA